MGVIYYRKDTSMSKIVTKEVLWMPEAYEPMVRDIGEHQNTAGWGMILGQNEVSVRAGHSGAALEISRFTENSAQGSSTMSVKTFSEALLPSANPVHTMCSGLEKQFGFTVM
jgi:hypothetical protein